MWKNHVLMQKVCAFLEVSSVPLILIAKSGVCVFPPWSRVSEESLALLLFLTESIVLIRSLLITSNLKAGHPVI